MKKVTKPKSNRKKTKAEITNERYSYVRSNIEISADEQRAFDNLDSSFDDNAITQAHFGLEMY